MNDDDDENVGIILTTNGHEWTRIARRFARAVGKPNVSVPEATREFTMRDSVIFVQSVRQIKTLCEIRDP